MRQKLTVIALVAAAVAWRLINYRYQLAPNLEIVTASSLVAAVWYGRRYGLLVPLAIMAASDALIGNTAIMAFTWSAFAVIGLAGTWLSRLRGNTAKLVAASAGAAIASSLFFFVFTNFGVWLLQDGSMYPKTWAGLAACYVAGIPFYRTMLAGNIMLVPTFFIAASVLGIAKTPATATHAASSPRQT